MKKDRELFLAAIKDMFRFLAQNGLGIPAAIEFEHHIAKSFIDDLLKEGIRATCEYFDVEVNLLKNRFKII
jgi:hypothetical protein